MIRRLPALFAAALLCTFALPRPAIANYPCPGGPGPGEQQIGVSGGSHGIAATPVCAQSGGGGYGGGEAPQGPVSPPVEVDNVIAVAGHPGHRDVWATWGQFYVSAAEKVVLDACTATMGEGCYVMVSGRNMSVAAGVDKTGITHAAYADSPRKARSALTALCKSRGRSCSLIDVFDAPVRSDFVEVIDLLYEEYDREGTLKSYRFPEDSRLKPPARGQPDSGVGTIALQDHVLKKIRIDGVRLVSHSADGTWIHRKDEKKKGMGCSIAYTSGAQRLIFAGPTTKRAQSGIMISGPNVPAVAEPRGATAKLTSSAGAQDIPVTLLPAAGGEAAVVLVLVDIDATVANFVDATPYRLELDGKPVLDVQVGGGMKAKTVMQQCRRGK